MKIKEMIAWNWKVNWISLVSAMCIILFVNALLISLFTFAFPEEEVRISTTEGCAPVMSLVIGMVTYAASLRFGGANSVSRRSVYLGHLGFAVTFCAAMILSFAVLDLAFSWSHMMKNDQVFCLMYGRWMQGRPAWQGTGVRMVWSAVLCISLSMLGYFLGGAFYRLGKMGKLVLAIGLPVGLFGILPMVILALPEQTQQALMREWARLVGFVVRSPGHSGLIALSAAAVFAALGWLLVRRAPVNPAGGP